MLGKKVELNTDNIDKIKFCLKKSGTGLGFMSNGSVKAVAQMIQANETIVYAVCANVSLGEPHGKLKVQTYKFKNKITGVVAVTNERVIFGARSGFSASKIFYLTDINDVDDRIVGGLMGAVLRIKTASSAMAIDGTKKTLIPLRDAINDAINLARQSIATDSEVVRRESPADEILKFKNLLDQGIITQEEFDTKKKQLLGL